MSITVRRRSSPARLDSYAEQFALADTSLQELRSTNWKEAGYACERTFRRKDGVNILKWVEVSNLAHIIAYLPAKDCVVTVNYWGSIKELSGFDADVNNLIESIPLDH